MKFTTCLFMSACLLLLAACSTTQERRLSPLEQEQAEQRLGEALAQTLQEYLDALRRAVDTLEPSGASPSEIAVAAHQRCIREFSIKNQAAIDYIEWKGRGQSRAALQTAKNAMYKSFERDRQRAENIAIQRVVEIRAGAVKPTQPVSGGGVLERLSDTKLKEYARALIRAADELEPSGAPAPEIAAAALARCRSEFTAAKQAHIDLFTWRNTQAQTDKWTRHIEECDEVLTQTGTDAVILHITEKRADLAAP